MTWPQVRLGRQHLLLLVGVVLSLATLATLLLRPPAQAEPAAGPPAGALGPSLGGLAEVDAVPAVAAVPRLTAEPDGQTLRLVSGGRDRAVLVQDPSDDQAARGLVLVLGPHSLTAARTAQELRFDDLRRRGYAVAYPSTLDGDWNAGRCCGSPRDEGVDDVAFLRQVRRQLLARYALPDRSVGLVGYSTGGQMVYRTVCSDPGFARAAVVVAGSLETDCAPGQPLPPTLVVHGLQDSTVPWDDPDGSSRLLGYAPTPARSSYTDYARAGRCGPPLADRSDGRTLLRWTTCTRLGGLTVVGMPGTGHGWTPLGGSVYATRFLPTHLER